MNTDALQGIPYEHESVGVVVDSIRRDINLIRRERQRQFESSQTGTER
jgi:hypothetical protein